VQSSTDLQRQAEADYAKSIWRWRELNANQACSPLAYSSCSEAGVRSGPSSQEWTRNSETR
jgi:hypothetical protein